MRRKGQVESLGTIFWGALLLIICLLFSILFWVVNGHLHDAAFTKDQRVDWEAGYLTSSLARSLVTVDGKTESFATYLDTHQGTLDQNLVQSHLDAFRASVHIPERKVLLFVSVKKTYISSVDEGFDSSTESIIASLGTTQGENTLAANMYNTPAQYGDLSFVELPGGMGIGAITSGTDKPVTGGPA